MFQAHLVHFLPQTWDQLFSKETCFLLASNGIWRPQSGLRGAHYDWVCHCFSAFSVGTARARKLINFSLYIYLSINLYIGYVCVCVYIYIVKVKYIMSLYWCVPQNSSWSHSSYTSISLFFKLKIAVLNHTNTSYSFTSPHTTLTIISE